jgi:hypothetical protein
MFVKAIYLRSYESYPEKIAKKFTGGIAETQNFK